MSKALPGSHYCLAHQGNHSHYATHNCTVCKLTAQRDALLKALRPFAEAAKQFDRGPGGHLPTDRVGRDSSITAAMLWTAVDVLNKGD